MTQLNQPTEQEIIAQNYRQAVKDFGRPLRVAYVIPRGGVGGGEWLHIINFIHTEPSAAQITIFLLRQEEPFTSLLRASGIKIISPPVKLQTNMSQASQWLTKQLVGFDIIHYLIHQFWPYWPTINSTSSPSPTAIVVSIVSNQAEVMTNQMYRQVDAVIYLSSAAKRTNQLSWPARTLQKVILCGIPIIKDNPNTRRLIRQKYQIPDTAQVLLWVGRLYAWEKNADLLQQAIAATANRQVWWIVIGYFTQNNRAEQRWQRFIKQQPYVIWLNHLQNNKVAPYYQAADIITSTSIVEGFGVALADGLAAGLPAVATDSGGSRHLVINNYNGYLTSVKSDDYINALKQLLTLPAAKKKQFGANGRRLVEQQFNPATVSQQYILAYHQALAIRRQTPFSLPTLPQPRKVVFILQAAELGGLCWRALYTAAHLQQLGYQVRLIFRNAHPNKSLIPLAARFGVAAEIASESYLQDTINFQDWNDYLAKRLAVLEPDIVQVGWLGDKIPPAVVDGRWRAMFWIAGPPSVVKLQQQPILADRFYALVAVSQSMVNIVPTRWQHKVVRITSGTNVSWYRVSKPLGTSHRQLWGLDAHATIAVWGGRINDPTKRPDLLWKLARSFNSITFVVCAINHQEGSIWYERLRRCTNVVWLNNVSPLELPLLYPGADFGLSTSAEEGISQASIEMLASGLPLILTSSPGAAEIVTNGKNGFLVPSGDWPALKKAVNEFLQLSTGERRLMGVHSLDKAHREFNVNGFVPAYYRLYRQDFDIFTTRCLN